MTIERSAIASRLPGQIFFPGRSASLSSQIIADVRDALFGKKLKPGDFLGTENELAERYGVSRIVARDALRTLQASGIVEIKMGKGGGARIARGNPRLFAEALAVQLDLTGVTAAEIMDAQRAIECLAAELAAENATEADIARLRQLIADADASFSDAARFTALGAEFHLAVAEASHNRVLVVQLISLQHVSWPRRNPTLNPKVMRRIQDVHKELLGLIEIRDAAAARAMMDDHVKMIRARRVAELGKPSQPLVPAKAGTQSGKSDSQPLGSRHKASEATPSSTAMRGSERSARFRVTPSDDDIGCC